MIQLSRTQKDVLEQAIGKYKRDLHPRHMDQGWFYPQRHECAEVFATHATCKALCGRGLLEFRAISVYERAGKWYSDNEYRVTQAGIEALP